MTTPSAEPVSAASITMRKVLWRILPLPFLLGFISIVDRTNIGYAALQMNKDLGLSATAFGFGAGILFLGYFAFEVPSNFALARFGARLWLGRIAVSWGILSVLTALAWNDLSFFAFRFLLGVAEAGLFPGVVLYLTLWFPRAYRAKALGFFMASVPASSIVGGPLSGWLLTLDGAFGLRGWQLIFVIEGLPAVVLGVLTWFLLKDRPADARWLSTSERDWLTSTLATEAAEVKDPGHGRIIDAFKNKYVWLFTIMYFCYACGSYGVSLFLPQIIKQFEFSDLQVGFIAAVPYLVGLIVMLIVARSSDRTGERRLHFGIPMLVAAVGLCGAGLSLQTPLLALLFMIVGVSGLMSSLATFWPRPTSMITGTVAIAGIAVINSFGNIGGFVGPYVVGSLTDAAGGSYGPALGFLTALAAIGGILALFVRKNSRDPK